MSAEPMPRAGWNKMVRTARKRDQRDHERRTQNGYATAAAVEANVVRIADRQKANGQSISSLTVITRAATPEELAAFDARTRLFRARVAGLGPGLPPIYREMESRS